MSNIEHINEFDTLNAGREKINKHAIDPANRAELNSIDAKSVANQANQTSQSAEAIAINTDDRLDNIIAGEMQDAEVIDARRPFGSEAYATLGERLDSEKAKFSAQLAHTWNNLESFPRMETETDDTGRIQRLINATPVGETVFIPYYDEWLNVSGTITIDKNIHFISKAKIGYSGTRDKPVFVLDRLTGVTFDIFKLADGNNATDDYANNYGGYHGWDNDDYIGVHAINLKWCTLKSYEIRNFSTGVRTSAQDGGGYWFNKHYFLNLTNNRIHIDINSDGVGSWTNANYFYESSIGYGTSHKPFLTDVKMKYGILQTLTNRNTYGGNSNLFYDFKFETYGNYPNGFTQIELHKAHSWVFDNYRNEILGTNTPLLVMDLSHTDTSLITPGAHSGMVVLKPVQGFEKNTIIYKNTENINVNYPSIAKLDNWTDSLITKFKLENIHHLARKVDGNRLIIRGCYFTDMKNTNPLLENVSAYSGVIARNTVTIPSSNPLVVYLDNLKKGDTVVIETQSMRDTNPEVGLELFDKSGLKINGAKIGAEKVLGWYGDYNANTGTITPYTQSNTQTFTVNTHELGQMRLTLAGTVTSFQVKSTSNDLVVTTSKTDRKPNKFYYSSKPISTFDGNFDIGDVVYNSGTESGQPIGWVLENVSGTLTWDAFGTQ